MTSQHDIEIAIEDFISETSNIELLVGKVMSKFKGKPNPKVVREIATRLSNLDLAFRMGKDGYHCGAPFSPNPYLDDAMREKWEEGWLQSQGESKWQASTKD